jgi:hypothetical protein
MEELVMMSGELKRIVGNCRDFRAEAKEVTGIGNDESA